MLAAIAIVGRPNVGKSTLFNRLTGTRDALVSDFPGLTRDRHYGVVEVNERQALIIDTGGVSDESTAIALLMAKQTALALQEAELILFLIDAKSGVIAVDEVLARRLRKLNKPILLVVNKIDGQDQASVLADCQQFGFADCFLVSAEHGVGVAELLTAIASKLSPAKVEQPIDSTKKDAIKVAFVGRPNVGKSTLVNRILGEERLVVDNQPGTTRDSIEIGFERRGKNYILVDTAGVRRRSKVQDKVEKFSIIKTLQAIAAAQVVVFLVDATENITDQDLKLLGFGLDAGKALVIAVNKWDNLLPQVRKKIQSELDRRLRFLDFAKLHFISALHGSGVGNLFNSINRAYFNATRKLKTAELNRILEQAVGDHQPPLVQGREVRLLYAHAGNQLPPTVIIHGTRTQFLPESYRRYLEHSFLEKLHLTGTPLRVIYKN